MKKLLFFTLLIFIQITSATAQSSEKEQPPVVKTANGIIEGINDSGVKIFKGIPYAQPPVGDLRWKPPQPAKNWSGVRKAQQFGPGCMQRPIFGDMNFRFPKMSENCLYLNVWTPEKKSDAKLPVLVYFYGGGFLAGDGSEPRYDGESMARNKGIVAITANYRLNVFGFFAYPGLTKESPHHASGNYGLLDQVQVLRWVKQNIAAFGGDPNKVTIAGESAGSMSVSGLMASPLSKKLFRGADGESGGLFGPLTPAPLSVGEQNGDKFAKMVGAKSLSDLRSMSAKDLLKATGMKGSPYFSAIVDGYFLPKSPTEIFSAGEQAHVPLFVGWNSEEMSYMALLRGQKPTPENFEKVVNAIYGKNAGEILKLFPHSNEQEVIESATSLASDRFTLFSTWKWAELQSKTGGEPVYRYYFSRARPAMNASMGNARAGLAGGVIKGKKDDTAKVQPPKGAVHSAEIEYIMGNLSTNKVYDWSADDYKVSHIFQDYLANFVKTGNPNGLGLPKWVPFNEGSDHPVMQIDVDTYLRPAKHRKQLLFLDQLYSNDK
ncbi:MAG TPA: carboxylesterase family protein [Balneolales bacterium]|nr:carboxylesterase family protein [Balneolales bacterium]